MDFVKMNVPTDYEIKVVHCKDCDCEDTEEASLRKKASKATGG